MLDENDLAGDADGDMNAGDLESILGLCVAHGMSQRMLRWHYRSRHHSLIAVSNREFYENQLYVVPSPTTITALHGLHFRRARQGWGILTADIRQRTEWKRGRSPKP